MIKTCHQIVGESVREIDREILKGIGLSPDIMLLFEAATTVQVYRMFDLAENMHTLFDELFEQMEAINGSDR